MSPLKAGKRSFTQNHGEESTNTPPTDSAMPCSDAARALDSSVMRPTQSAGLLIWLQQSLTSSSAGGGARKTSLPAGTTAQSAGARPAAIRDEDRHDLRVLSGEVTDARHAVSPPT